MELFSWIIDSILWFFAFKSSNGSFASMVAYRLLYGILLIVSIVGFLGAIWLLFGHIRH